MPLWVGTSGWQYDGWRGVYYPDDVPKARWLEWYLRDFRTLELNAPFYRLPSRDTFVSWRDRSPADAVFAVKASRYLTHIRRLRDPQEPVARLLDRATGLGPKLGPVLLQLPPNLPAEPALLDATLACFAADVRVAVEPRHASWFGDETRAVLAARGAALVWADRRGRPLSPLWRTAPWGYVRLHEGGARTWPFYGERSLASWVDRVATTYAETEDVFVYFNNDPGCAAVDNAVTFARRAARRGRAVTRVPSRRPLIEW